MSDFIYKKASQNTTQITKNLVFIKTQKEILYI